VAVLALEGGEVWALLGGYQIVFFGQGTVAYTRTEPGPSTPTVDIFSQSKALGALRSNLLGEVSLTAGQGETPYGNAMSVLTPARSQSESAGPFIIPTFRLIAINSDKTKMFAMTTAR